MFQGLTDETHTVVKQALVSIENILPTLLLQQNALKCQRQQNNHIKKQGKRQQQQHQQQEQQFPDDSVPGKNDDSINVLSETKSTKINFNNYNILLEPSSLAGNDVYYKDNYGNTTIENVIDALMLVYENKYWVVQSKYCDLISKLDFENIKLIYGYDRGQLFEVNLLLFYIAFAQT